MTVILRFIAECGSFAGDYDYVTVVEDRPIQSAMEMYFKESSF